MLSFLETNILLTSISFILNIFFYFVVEVIFWIFFVVKIYAIFTHSYTVKKKSEKIFNNNFGYTSIDYIFLLCGY